MAVAAAVGDLVRHCEVVSVEMATKETWCWG